jgi:hypothetical protein
MKKKTFIAIWVLATAGIFYFWSLRNIEEAAPTPKTPVKETVSAPKVESTPLTIDSEKLPLKLKSRIDTVLSKIEDMWDPTGTKITLIGQKMDALEVALEANNAELAEKVLSEIEVVLSEK